jgi:hypothetical protein
LGITLEFENKEPELFQNLTFIGHRFKLVEVPRTNLKVWVSDIDCRKMRCSMVHGFSENSTRGTVYSTLERACGIRNETFMCVDCRQWFSSIICFLMDQVRDDNSERAKSVRSCYLTDDQLWQIHTGLTNWEVKKLGDLFNSTTDPSSQAPLNKFKECRNLLIQSKILRS